MDLTFLVLDFLFLDFGLPDLGLVLFGCLGNLGGQSLEGTWRAMVRRETGGPKPLTLLFQKESTKTPPKQRSDSEHACADGLGGMSPSLCLQCRFYIHITYTLIISVHMLYIVHVYIHIYIHIYIYTCTYIYIYILIYIHMYI